MADTIAATETAPLPGERRRPSLAVLIAISCVGPMALNIYVPSMPQIQAAFNTDGATIQLTLSLYLIAVAVSQLIYGPLSDRHGRRPVVLFGLALYVVGSALAALAPNIESLIVARILQACGGSAGLVLARAVVRDLFDRTRAASMLGYMTMTMVLVPMVSPTIGGWLDMAFSWRASFLFCAAIGLLVTLLAFARLHESNYNRTAERGLAAFVAGYPDLLRSPAFLGYAAASALTISIYMAFLGIAPFLMVGVLKQTPAQYGLYFILPAFCYAAGNFMAGRYSERFGLDRMIRWGNLIVFGSAVMMAVWIPVWGLSPLALFVPMATISIGQGMALPNCMAGGVSVNPARAGAASGLMGASQLGYSAIVTTTLGGLGTDVATPYVFYALAASALAPLCHQAAMAFAKRARYQRVNAD
jgi:DHA1 family bicyclomycin/chloramphenicol resistance-like MFS transporter